MKKLIAVLGYYGNSPHDNQCFQNIAVKCPYLIGQFANRTFWGFFDVVNLKTNQNVCYVTVLVAMKQLLWVLNQYNINEMNKRSRRHNFSALLAP